MPQEPTDLRPAVTTPLAVTHLGFGAAEVGGPHDAVSDYADSDQASEPIVRHPARYADQRAEALIRDDSPTPA